MPARALARPLSVLVVDDAPDAAESLAAVLALSGFAVRAATRAADALAAAAADPPDVVLLDLNMPEMDGFELARRLRAHPWPGGRRPVLVAVSALGTETDRARSAGAGVDGHLVKPVDPSGLVRLLGALQPALAPAGGGAKSPPRAGKD